MNGNDPPICVEDIRPEYKTRLIVLALGTLVHDEDLGANMDAKKEAREKEKKAWGDYDELYYMPTISYLGSVFRNKITVKDKPGPQFGFKSVQAMATYLSPRQKVKYIIISVITKADFKKALETEGIHVIYQGHAFDEGLLFDNYEGSGYTINEEGGLEKVPGLHYGGEGNDAFGFFRIAYPYISKTVDEIEKWNLTVHPAPVEEGEPPNEKGHPYSRSPDCRKPCIPVKLDPSLQKYICTCHRSPSNTYYGYKTGHLLVRANWKGTISHPFDLGGVTMKCEVFCIFSCISRALYWDLIRRPEYLGWQKPTPPTGKFAYFTIDNSWITVTHYWLEYLLKYDKESRENPWESLEYARKKANDKLRMEVREYAPAKSHKDLKIW